MSADRPPLEGSLIWFELRTDDLDAAIDFYGELFGWRVAPEERASYPHFRRGDQAVAGASPDPLPEGDAPEWLVYVGTDSVEGFTARSLAASGELIGEVLDVPEVGKFAVTEDTEGARLVPFAPSDPSRESWVHDGTPGAFCWAELLCEDPAEARSYYTDVIGWKAKVVPMGPLGDYTLFESGPREVAGALPMPPDMSGPPMWLPYVAVEDVDATAAKALELGAERLAPTKDIPDVGRLAIFRDPRGAAFAVYQKLGAC